MQKQDDNLTEISPEAGVYLVQAEARLSAPHLPIRKWQSAPAIYDARTHADDSAGSWGKGSGDRERKQLQRACSELVKAGLIVRTRRTFGRKLTPAGKRWARARAWPFTAELLTTALARIDERVAAGDCRSNALVPETFVCGHAWGGDARPFLDLERLLLPAMVDGFVRSGFTMEKHVFYGICSNERIDSIVEQCVGDEPALDDELSRIFVAELSERHSQILHDTRHYNEIGEIPLPVSMPVESGRGYNDLRGITPLFPAATSGKDPGETTASEHRND
jgi:hypothetical protein